MRYRIALCGFSDFEHRAMDYSFRQPRGFPESGYDVVDALSDADFVVVDADSKSAVKGIVLSGREANTVFVGTTAPPGAASHLPRPIDPTRILRTLDELSGARELADPPPPPLRPGNVVAAARADPSAEAPPGVSPAVHGLPTLDDVVAAHEPMPVPATAQPAESTLAKPAALSDPDARLAAHHAAKVAARAAARRARQAARGAEAAHGAPLSDVLVFDADAAAATSLCELLVRFGFLPHVVRNLAQVGDELAARPFAALFLDIALDDVGVSLLRHVREMPAPADHPQPAVLLLASRLDPADRVAAALAGLPDPLIKPLGRGMVARALESSGVPLPSDARGA
jgi:CheY-like chemotaxis protein